MIDLSTFELSPAPRDREVDPIKIFNSLTLRGEVKFLSGPQQEALTQWHEKRKKPDILFSLNTGGGKTLVGLLAAQSLVNETKGKVVYACATNQLIEQTAAQAADCCINVATYGDQKWVNRDLFDSCYSCCVTNYHALFHGFSKFYKENIKAIIFDDAHVAPTIIRECFTLGIDTKHPAWGPLMSIFAGFFEKSSFASRFNRFRTPGKLERGVLFLPGWFVNERLEEISRALTDGDVDAEETKYAYAHLRDHLNQCGFFISHSRIEITPTVLPTHKLPYFDSNVRRIYMTATLPSKYQSMRTFGFERAEVIAPAGKAGAAQRLFIFADAKADKTVYDEARTLAAPRKACIIVPSGTAAKKWGDFGGLYDSRIGHTSIEQFKKETSPKKLILAALYDGIDLPGKSCNVLVLDGLPRGANLHDQFLEESLDIYSFRASNVAARTTQSIGRIFRSNTDHGVVILADKAQQSWLMTPENLSFMPYLLQQQIRLGQAIKKYTDAGRMQNADLMAKVIDGATDWDNFYNREIEKLEAEQKPKETKWGEAAAKNEYAAFKEMWEGRYEAAAMILKDLSVDAERHAPSHSAWYLHWVGVAHLLAKSDADARSFFWQASNRKLVLGRPDDGQTTKHSIVEPVGSQATRIAPLFDYAFRKSLDEVVVGLKSDGGANSEIHESNLKLLGEKLGFVCSRPDSEERPKKGPDVVWALPELKLVVAIEAKTQKESPKLYKKNQHIGKIHNDCEWLANKYPEYQRRLLLIGPRCAIVPQASPPPDLRIIQLEEFVGLAERLVNAAQHAVARFDNRFSAAVAIQK
jgi:hypothetical protein